MTKRIDLRAYQESIASRLAAAQAGGGVPALLGFATGATRWLIDLPAAGEVLPLPALTTVPLTQAWFAGLASVHGELQSVVDFSVFCGGAPTPRNGAARILRVGTRYGINAALLVARVHGLKRSDTLFAAEDDGQTSGVSGDWCGAVFTDTQGERWTRLELDRLLADPRFLDAALPEAVSSP
jgi:twitching motility protein PilI